jgi:hypothetical protein
MGIHFVKDKYYVFKGEKIAEAKFRTELSQLIVEKFGNGPFHDQKIVREIVSFSLDYYITKFKEICHKETSVRFYQNIFWLHEQATEIAYHHPHQDISPDISGRYIASYRRILKFILETGCEIQLVTGEKMDKNFRNRIEPILHDLLFLGEMILMCVDLYAEQTMIEDVADVSFDKNGLYVFSRRHHYEVIFEHIIKELGSHITKAIVDENGFDDFKTSLQTCFGIRYEDVGHLIAAIHEELKPKGGEVVGVGWDTLTLNLNRMFGVPMEIAEQFFRGLRLDKSTKMDLLDLACKPYKLNRYLYRPIIIWNIDGSDYALFGKNSWTETILQYPTNAIPWGKAPDEWMQNECFKNYVHKKEDDHDTWLDDDVEEKIKNIKLFYDRNVKHLKSANGNVSIDVPGLGEVDFIIVVEKLKKIFISDCKHLLGRYDIVNQKNDFNVFEVGSKKNSSYNQTMTNKLAWFNANKKLLQEHFQIKYNDQNISIEQFDVEGIFIVNTPTFYMYNAVYRIYTVAQLDEVLKGEFVDETFMIVLEEEDKETIMNVKYPYFQKPSYITYDPFEEDDKEGENH